MADARENSGIAVTLSRDNGDARVVLSGRLDASTLGHAWAKTVPATETQPPHTLTIDVSGLSYCDGAGLGLFAELRRVVSVAGGEMRLAGMRADQQRLLQMSQLKDPRVATLEPARKPGAVTQIGRSTWIILRNLRQLIVFTGELTATLAWAARHPLRVRGRDRLKIAETAGANALPVVSLLGLLVGVILAFQTANPLARFGAQPLIPTIVSIAVVRE